MSGADASDLAQAAAALARTLRRESALARAGGLADLVAASAAKRAAFDSFQRVGAAGRLPNEVEAAALRDLVAAADENVLALDAVRAVFDGFAARLREALCSAADPGVYDAAGAARRRVLAARLDAVI